MNSDFAEMLFALSAAGVDFIIVGAHALAAHGSPRATGDLDIWVRPSHANAERTMQALAAFGAPLFDLSAEDLTHTDTVFQMGVPPSRIDILAGITGVSFDDAWRRRVFVTVEGLDVPVLSKQDFVTNKRLVDPPQGSGRPGAARGSGRTRPRMTTPGRRSANARRPRPTTC